ncbi:hypothetical protein DITRI_Ditri05aG0011500 [Diplodiscus trichospermus]
MPSKCAYIEHIYALAASNNAQLMVVACVVVANSTALTLVFAALQTNDRVVCILPSIEQLQQSKKILSFDACHVESVFGETQNLLLSHYEEADFVLIDYNLENHERIVRAMQAGPKAFTERNFLLVTKIPPKSFGKKSH